MAIHTKISGKVQGAFTGDVTTKGYEKQINVTNISFGFARPMDSHSGLATGGTVARPIVITKPADQSTPLFMNACFNNEVLTAVTISFLVSNAAAGIAATVTNAPRSTLVLTNAIITTYDHQCDGAGGTGTDTITLSYQKMEYNWIPSSTTAANDWSTA
jgi:type VI secretion system secreted protein Hcp